MTQILLTGTVQEVRHFGDEASPHSTVTLRVTEPYQHLVKIQVFWTPVLYSNMPGEEFCHQLERQCNPIIIRASADEKNNLSAHRSDIYVSAPEHLKAGTFA